MKKSFRSLAKDLKRIRQEKATPNEISEINKILEKMDRKNISENNNNKKVAIQTDLES